MAANGKLSTLGFVEEIDYNELKIGEVVGRGAFGTVCKAIWRGIDVAVKLIETENEKRAFVQELKQLSRVNHENIIRLYGASTRYPVFLVMEFAECGNLYNLLHGTKPIIEYNAAHVISWGLQTALGVSYLHNIKPKAIIHRDLKPPNLLLVKEGLLVKICDFGTAADQQTHMTNNRGSAAWMAPEVFEGNRYSEKCDVFSFGIILWECFSRRKPFDEIGGPAFRIMWAIHSGTRPPLLRGMPAPLEVIMSRCWSKNPAERPSMDEIVRIMKLIMPMYEHLVAPINFSGGFFIEEDNEEEQQNEQPTVSPEGVPSDDAMPGTIVSGVLSKRNSEIVMLPLETEGEPSLEVIETGKRASGSMPLGDINTRLEGLTFRPQISQDIHIPANFGLDRQKRYSADLDVVPSLEFAEAPISATPQQTRKHLGHRRVGSHGNPPIVIESSLNGVPSVMPSRSAGMVSSVSHPGDSYMDAHRADLQPPHLLHSTSWHSDYGRPASDYSYRSPSSSGSQVITPPAFPQLDDSLKPLQPLPNSEQSVLIYYEQVALAEDYISLQNQTAQARKQIELLEKRIAEEEQKERQRQALLHELNQLLDENEELTNCKEDLMRQMNTHSPLVNI